MYGYQAHLRNDLKCVGWDVKPCSIQSIQSLGTKGVELVSPKVWVLAGSRSLSFKGDSDSGHYLFYLDLCVILLQSI